MSKPILVALQVVFDLAEENALRDEELGDSPLLTEEFEAQQHALEVVQEYIDTDVGATMTRYTQAETLDALKVVLELGRDNVLDEELCGNDPVLLDQRNRQNISVTMVTGFIDNLSYN